METHLTEKELAARFQISTRWVQKLRAKGGGPAFVELGGSPKMKTIRYRLSDVIAYEESRVTGGAVPVHCQKAMRRAADALDVAAGWSSVSDKARTVLVDIRDQLRRFIGEGE